MGSPKLAVTADGRITSVAYTNDTKLPPMVMVGINEALADVPPDATWLSKTDYKFEHFVTPEEMKKADFIEYVLRWMAARLDAGGASMNADTSGPLHGYLREAWKSQEPIILDWSDDPNGLEEQWAQLYSELFAGVNYDSPGISYKMGERSDKAWDEYVYSRLQSEYLEHATSKKGSDRIGISIESWENPVQRNVSEKEYDARAWKTNDDPASPLACTCQYLTTFGFITRGFRIEYAKKELQYMRGVVGFSAGPAFGYTNVLQSWVWRDDAPVKEIPTMIAASPPLAPATVYTFHAHHQLSNQSATVEVVKKDGKPVRNIQDILEKRTGKLVSKLKEEAATLSKEEKSKFDSLEDKTGYTYAAHQVAWTGQPAGAHIFHVLRVHKDKSRAQLFDARGGNDSRSAMESETESEPRGRALIMGPGVGCNMDTKAFTSVYENPNGMGVAKAAPDLEKQIETMKKARPIGLVRLVITERKPVAELNPEHVLFVSKLLRTYGDADHQNYTLTRYLWSLRNTPGFSSVQPWWFVFLPIGVLARCMWAVGSRKMKLSDFMNQHAGKVPPKTDWFRLGGDGDLSLDVNYIDSMLFTNIANPQFPGRAQIARRVKSEPVFPNSARLVTEGITRLPAAFTQALPGVPAPRNVILPEFTNKKGDIEHNGQRALGWNFIYVRADIEGADRLRALTGPLLDYFREG